MSEDEARRAANEEQGDEVEAHRGHVRAANEEAGDESRRSETPESDDVEAHGHHLRQTPKKA
jgi:hypothetical protein